MHIAEYHPDARDTCVAVLTGLLEHFAENDTGLNTHLISALIDLGAVESAPVMEQAFKADVVELEVHGDWEEVQIALGLLDERITPKPPYGWFLPKFNELLAGKPTQQTAKPGANAQRNKRKAQRKARKKNKRK